MAGPENYLIHIDQTSDRSCPTCQRPLSSNLRTQGVLQIMPVRLRPLHPQASHLIVD